VSCATLIAAGNYAGAFILIHQGIPCIKLVLLEGYDVLPADTAKNKYIKDFETLFNSHVLGTLMQPAS
jgi:hypothetical protein